MSSTLLKVLHADLDVDALRPALDETPHDHHFGKDYRFRSMSRFEVANNDFGFCKLEKKPLYQSGVINPIKNYGGIYRDYSELPNTLTSSEDFGRLVRMWLDALPEPRPKFSVHHIRTLAPGAPTPEGRHRDGYEYVGIGVLQRRGIAEESAITRVWEHGGTRLVFEGTLREGDFAMFDDRKHLHATSEVRLENGVQTGVRDVLIFTVPDHGAIVEGTEVH